ncbi:MAG: hypothetical protein A2639_01915 [Candidatus Staskawiczbacteria bacterium RIFCSPHIGHO2_01_FULL_34_27]|uniref:Uncharacterized protein n=1 Tax=Candidatus Staskawiczbacteria bacterium RIFCSPHIGHO2_01_FULL_34_27 TaxID=1802199 RepID=A0A1G2HKY3_9BACT|nr:MAG: hypothetical protein A2639_01915 [Candidatus Staskawiczbacteria bacterium RIFCSPHIGHO2_01_FULL_34_27]
MFFNLKKRYLVVGSEFGQEDLNLERFKARSDWAAKKIFLSYWSKYSCFDLTLYRVTFFGNMIYIANND